MRRRGSYNVQYKSKYKFIKTEDGKCMYLHRYIMEQHLGRKLDRWENVHHIDGDKFNNDISNLEILSHADHSRHHMTEMNIELGLNYKGANARWNKETK